MFRKEKQERWKEVKRSIRILNARKINFRNSNQMLVRSFPTWKFLNWTIIFPITAVIVIKSIGPDDFKLIKLLETSGYSLKYLVEKRTGIDEGKMYAMKVLNKASVLEHAKLVEHVKNEREVLEMAIDCPFNATLRYAFQTPYKLYLVTDFNQAGDIFAQLALRTFTEDDARFYLAEIVLALDQMHKQNIVYRDLKAESVMLDSKGHVVLSDYNSAKNMKDQARTVSYCGTSENMVSANDLLLIQH